MKKENNKQKVLDAIREWAFESSIVIFTWQLIKICFRFMKNDNE